LRSRYSIAPQGEAIESKVAITGDFKRTKPVKEDLVLMTTESLDSKSRSMASWLQKVTTIVADEAHLLSVDKRGDAFEIGLTRTSLLTDARIVFLSATMPNVEELSSWLTSLNGRRSEIVRTDWRPVELEYEFIQTSNQEWDFNDDALRCCRMAIRRNPESSILVFVHSIAKGNKLSKQLNCPFHCSRNSLKVRTEMEDDFRAKRNKVLVSTSTLAWGINMPCDIGIIVGGHRGPMAVDIYDMKQMAGRIGRYGMSKKGKVFFVLKKRDFDRVKDGLLEVRPVTSVLPERLYFHLCSFVAREELNYEEIVEFLEKTLAWKQGLVNREVLDRAVEKLQMYKILSDKMEPSSIAKASAYMYVDPIDLWYIRRALSIQPKEAKKIAKAFATVPSMAYEITLTGSKINWVECGYSAQTALATALYYWLEGEDMPMELNYIIYQFNADLPRWLAALRMCGTNKDYATELELVMLNGVPFEAAQLTKIPGVGRKKASKLISAGIMNKEDLLADKKTARILLGPKTYQQAIAFLENNTFILQF